MSSIWATILKNLLSPAKPLLLKESSALRKLAARPTSLTLRHLDCGSCNGCELQLNALTNPHYDIERYGISFESSPRHATYLAMTGAFTKGLSEAAELTLRAMPKPRIIAIGDCAVNGGTFGRLPNYRNYALEQRSHEIMKAIKIKGCPPAPQDILDAIARIVVLARRS
jgi:Ni,Fe-hydrogenase III small subunit